MRNFLLLVFIVVSTAVTSLDHYMLMRHRDFCEDANNYYVARLADTYRAANYLGSVADSLVASEERQRERDTVSDNFLTVLKAQQEEARRLNGLLDDLSNKYGEKVDEVGRLRLACQGLYEHLQLACEYINTANKILREHGLPLPDIQYDGEKLFDEDASKKDKST